MENSVIGFEGSRVNIIFCLLTFLFFWFLAQLVFISFPAIGFLLISLACILLTFVLFFGNRNDLFLCLFITTAMSITLPFAPRRELELILPSAFFLISIIRFFPKFLLFNRRYTHFLVCYMGIFALFCFIGIFNQIKIPWVNANEGENSGFLNRFNLFNSVIVFLDCLILFDYKFIEKWLKYFFKFYLIVLSVSILVILFNAPPFPFFNTFSWSLIIENEGSKKMIIAGVAASFVLIYTLAFIRKQILFYLIIFLSLFGLLISGSRISFLAGVLMIFISYVMRRKILGKSLIIICVSIFLSFYLLLSPLVLLVPEKYQRLVILFPPEYYTGKLAHLSKSAAASSSSFRVDIWSMAIEKILRHPIIGNSFGAPQASYDFEGNSLEGFQKIPTKVLYNDFLVTGSLHNTFFGIAYILGIPALLVFTFSMVRLIWLHYKNSIYLDRTKRDIAMFMSILLTNYFVVAMVADLIFDLQFFLILGITLKVLLFYYRDIDIVSDDWQRIS